MLKTIHPILRLYLLLAILLTAGYSVILLQSWFEVNEGGRETLAYVTRMLAQTTRATLVNQEETLRLIGHRLLQAGSLQQSEAGRSIIERAQQADAGMAGFGLARKDGQLVLVSGIDGGKALPNLRQNRVSRESFDAALTSPRLQLGRPYFMVPLQEWVIPIRVALQDFKGKRLAMMTAGYKISGGSTTWARLDLPPQVALSIIRQDGYAQFVHPVDSKYQVYQSPYRPELVGQIRRYPGNATSVNLNPGRGEDALLGHIIRLPEYGLTVLSSLPQSWLWQTWFKRNRIPTLLYGLFLIISWCGFQTSNRSQNRYEDHLLLQAHRDSLTGLPNRLSAMQFLQNILVEEKRPHQTAVMFLDLDHFKRINDNYGHELGDELIKQVGGRLREGLPEGALVARQGGDEFILIADRGASSKALEQQVKELLKSLAEPFNLQLPAGGLFGQRNRQVRITASIGIVLAPAAGIETPTDALRRADSALYQVKNSSRNNFAYYSEKIYAQIRRRMTIEEELPTAIAEEQFSVNYQPQVDCNNDRIVGVEALVRWQSPNLEMVSPGEFIPIAEETGHIHAIDRMVLRQACSDIANLARHSGRQISLSVNFSAREILSSELPRTIATIIAETGLAPRHLTAEITETALLEDFELAFRNVELLKQMGVQISLDDFGTGFSSLTLLHRLPVSELKVDRSFVRDILIDPRDATLVRSIIRMGQNLGASVVAEGVETEAQLAEIKRCGCDLVQGYFLARPMPYADLVKFVEESLGDTAAESFPQLYPCLEKA